jgi:hypothetical protein
MKILFLCGSAEPGKDGVGDYSRRLCGALIRKGHKAQIIALCDKQSKVYADQEQEIEGTLVSVSRIPQKTPYKERFKLTQKLLSDLQPDWLSLQYVPYSFNPSGLPFWLPSFLKKLTGNHQWHIMFHELWLGIENGVSFKKKCVGMLQKKLIVKINKSVQIKVVHTQAKVYQHYLSKINMAPQYLPLFGNISVTADKNNYIEQVVFVVFATIHHNAPFEDFIIELKKELYIQNKRAKFVFIGRSGGLLTSWTQVLDTYEIEYELLGMRSEAKISQVLMNGDYGISSTPYKISDKSGVVAAMREHQLPIITVAKSWEDQDGIAILFNYLIHYKKGQLNLGKYSEAMKNDLRSVSANFMKAIKN